MKKFTLMLFAAFFAVVAYAQKGVAMRAAEPVAPPTTATVETWYTAGGKFFVSDSGWKDYTSKMETINVAIDGNDIYLQGLSFWFPETWIKGTISGTTAIFDNGQFLGEDEEGEEFLCGSDDGTTLSENISFAYDATEGTLTAITSIIIEGASAEKVLSYAYWLSPVFSKNAPEKPEAVVLPEGVVAEDFIMSYSDGQKPVKVAVDGNDVYFQGMSKYIPQAWVKGTKDGNIVTFAPMQFMGEYGDYGGSYFFYGNTPVTFIYDAEAETYSATGLVYGVLDDKYYDGKYTDPVLKKVIEVAVKPATPKVLSIENTQYGDIVNFNIPVVDVNGNGMIADKLSFQFFIDDENTPMTFTTSYFTRLESDMTIIPYGFTEDYDFQIDYIYLNMPHSTWNKIGIQSIYTGGGETNKSEISWYEIPKPVVAPEGLAVENYAFKATATEAKSDPSQEKAEPYTSQIKIGFDGDDVYIQGLCPDMAELWVKATKNEAGKYVIPANQYMGNYEFLGYVFPYYWTAVDEEGNMVETVLDYDSEKGQFTSAQTLILNGGADGLDPYITFTDVIITKLEEVAATPANPTVEAYVFNKNQGYNNILLNIPTVGTEGEDLILGKLFYILWIMKDGQEQPYTFSAALYDMDFNEDVTEVPYTHDGYDVYLGGKKIYLEETPEELATWMKVGVQSIYYGAGERRTSEIAWCEITTDIKSIDADKNGKAVIYNLNGQRVETAKKGLYIVNGHKVVVK